MGGALETAENLMHAVIEWGIILLELFGVCILVYTSVTCFVKWIRKEQNIRLELAQGTTLALSFKMGGEVLRTVVVREWRELGILGAVIVLRTALTLLLHWEIENEKKDLEGLEIVTDESILDQKKTRKPEEKAGNA